MERELILSSKSRSSIGDLEDSPRIILVVCNAAITHPPVGHDWVKTSIVEGCGCATEWRLGEAVDSSVSSVFVLDSTSLLIAHEEEQSTHDASNGKNSDNDACGDGGYV
jgi:hypothetical protein